VLWQRYSKNKLKAIHNEVLLKDSLPGAVAKVFKEQIESNSQPTERRLMLAIAVAKVFKEQIESNSQQWHHTQNRRYCCGKGIQRTN